MTSSAGVLPTFVRVQGISTLSPTTKLNTLPSLVPISGFNQRTIPTRQGQKGLAFSSTSRPTPYCAGGRILLVRCFLLFARLHLHWITIQRGAMCLISFLLLVLSATQFVNALSGVLDAYNSLSYVDEEKVAQAKIENNFDCIAAMLRPSNTWADKQRVARPRRITVYGLGSSAGMHSSALPCWEQLFRVSSSRVVSR